MYIASANPVNELRFGQSEQLFGRWHRLHDLIRTIWPAKTSAHLAHATGLSQRAAELSLAERRQFAPDTLVALLKSPHGAEILLALTEDSEEEWVKQFGKWWTLQKLEARQAELQRQINELKNQI